MVPWNPKTSKGKDWPLSSLLRPDIGELGGNSTLGREQGDKPAVTKPVTLKAERQWTKNLPIHTVETFTQAVQLAARWEIWGGVTGGEVQVSDAGVRQPRWKYRVSKGEKRRAEPASAGSLAPGHA